MSSLLSPSERVSIIDEIAARLAEAGWTLIDLTLTQFGLSLSLSSGGNKYDHVVSILKDASDPILINLGQHVGVDFGEPKPLGLEPPFWRKDMLRVFLSHLAAERKFAAELQDALLRFGITCFVAHTDIEPTLEWETEIQTALTTCDALVALLHPKFHQSNWTDQEIGFAMGRGVPAFAVHVGQDPYGFIGRFQAFTGNGKNPLVMARELFDAFRKHKQTSQRMSGILVNLFEQSGSFDTAKMRMGYLEELDYWEASYPARLLSAVKGNPQVADAWGVPARVEALVKKWGMTTSMSEQSE